MVGPAHLWELKRRFQEDFLRARGLAPEHYLLDIGCGTLRGGVPLIAHLEPEHYCGAEVRAEVLEEAHKELAEAGLEHKAPRLVLCEDIASLALGQRFDYVWAFSVLIHMTDSILMDTLRFARRHLAPTGEFYANVNIGSAVPREWQGFPVVYRRREDLSRAAAACGLALEDLGELAAFGHVSGEPVADAQHMMRFRLLR